jgi:hypothetical protein
VKKMAKAKKVEEKKNRGARRRRNSGMPRIVVATGNPRGGAMARSSHRRRRSNPGRRHGYHSRRRNPPPRKGGGIGKILVPVAVGLLSGAAAFGVPELMKLSGAQAYLPGGALLAGGLFIAKKNPMLGLAVAVGAVAGAGAPIVASKILPAPTATTMTPAIPATTAAIIGALGPRLDVPRMAAVIQGIGDVYGPRADVLTRGY